MKLAVEVQNAVDLMPKDGQESASPYVQVEIDGQIQRTKTVHKDLHPSFNQTLFFNIHDPSHLSNQSIEVSVYHDRTINSDPGTGGQNRNFLGRVKITGESIAHSPETAQIQRYPLEKRGMLSYIRGDIALRVYLLPDSGNFEDPDPIPVIDPQPIPFFTIPESVGSNDEQVEKKVNEKLNWLIEHMKSYQIEMTKGFQDMNKGLQEVRVEVRENTKLIKSLDEAQTDLTVRFVRQYGATSSAGHHARNDQSDEDEDADESD